MWDERSPKRLAGAAFSALALVAAGCAAPSRTPPPQSVLSGRIAIERIYSSGRIARESGPVTQTPAFAAARMTMRERLAVAGRTSISAADALGQPASGVFRAFTWRDSAGNAVAIRFASGRPQLLVEDFSHALRSNRTIRSDGSYREIANALAKNATIVSTADSSGRAAGSWKVEIFPHVSEASSTYYGFLNDAKVEYDFALRASDNGLRVFGNGGYASGYSTPGPMRAMTVLPSELAASATGSDARIFQTFRTAAAPPECSLAHAIDGLRKTRESLLERDALSGTVESTDTQGYLSPRGGVECIRIAARLQYFPLSPLRAGVEYLRSIAISETLTANSADRNETIPPGYLTLVRDGVQAMLSAEIAQSRAAALRELALARPGR